MAITLEGSQFVGVSGQNPTPTITVPAGTTFALVWYNFHCPTPGADMSTATINGVSMTKIVSSVIVNDRAGTGVFRLANPATGSQTLALGYSATPTEGPCVWVSYYSGVDLTSPVIDADVLTWDGTATNSVTIDSETTSRVDAVGHSYFTPYDGAPSGSGQTVVGSDTFNTYKAFLINETTPGASSSTVSVQGSYGGVCAVALRAATAGGAFEIDADAAALTLTAAAAGLVAARRISADAPAHTLTAADAALVHGYLVAADASSLSLGAADAALTHAYRLTADAAALAVSTPDAALVRTYRLTAEVASLALVAADAGVTAARRLSADAPALSMVVSNASLVRGYRLTAELAQLTLSIADGALAHGYRLAADAAAASLSASAAGLVAARKLLAELAALSLSAADAAMTASGAEIIAADAPAYALTAPDAALAAARRLSAEASSLALVADGAALVRASVLQAQAAALALAAVDASLSTGSSGLVGELAQLVLTAEPATLRAAFLFHGQVRATGCVRVYGAAGGALQLTPSVELASFVAVTPVGGGNLEQV